MPPCLPDLDNTNFEYQFFRGGSTAFRRHRSTGSIDVTQVLPNGNWPRWDAHGVMHLDASLSVYDSNSFRNLLQGVLAAIRRKAALFDYPQLPVTILSHGDKLTHPRSLAPATSLFLHPACNRHEIYIVPFTLQGTQESQRHLAAVLPAYNDDFTHAVTRSAIYNGPTWPRSICFTVLHECPMRPDWWKSLTL